MKLDNRLEKSLESDIRKYAKSLKILCYKFVSPGNRSVPDRLFAYKGKVFFFEMKRRGKGATPAQQIEHEKLRAHGIEVYVVDNVPQGKTILNRIVLEAE